MSTQTIEWTMTDPVSGEELVFSGDTEAEVERLVDEHFGVTLADAAHNSTLEDRKRQTSLRRELKATQAKLETANRRMEKYRLEYASSPDGIAETWRRYETSGDLNVRDLYARGVELSLEEFCERVSYGHSSDDDGAQAAAVLSEGHELTPHLVAENVTGTYLNSKNSREDVRTDFTLMRVDVDGTRRRMSIRVEGAPPVTLNRVLEIAWSDSNYRSRLRRMLGTSRIPEVLDRSSS